MMSSYPYAWLLVVIVVGTPVLLTNAYLALIALMFVLPVVLLALAAAIVWVPYVPGRYAGRRWREHAATRTPRALSTARQRAGAR
jgi:membrane protein DedA with SNARE-associated domain